MIERADSLLAEGNGGSEVETPPRRAVFAITRFGLDRKRVLDAGCGSGRYLALFGPGSMGLEQDATSIAEAHRRALDVRQWDLDQGCPADLRGRFDAVWASALLEHLLRPHEFLVNFRLALRPGGLMMVLVPQTAWRRWGPWRAFMAADHVNFYTSRTLRWTIERAGYRLVYLGTASLPRIPLWLGRALAPVGPSILAIGQPIPEFQYPRKANRTLVSGRIVSKHSS